MELLVAILLALGVSIYPGKSPTQIREEYSAKYVTAQTIIATNAYYINDAGVVIIDDGTGD